MFTHFLTYQTCYLFQISDGHHIQTCYNHGHNFTMYTTIPCHHIPCHHIPCYHIPCHHIPCYHILLYYHVTIYMYQYHRYNHYLIVCNCSYITRLTYVCVCMCMYVYIYLCVCLSSGGAHPRRVLLLLFASIGAFVQSRFLGSKKLNSLIDSTGLSHKFTVDKALG